MGLRGLASGCLWILILVYSAAAMAEEVAPQVYEWEGSGSPYQPPPRSRTGFFIAGGPQIGGFVNEIRRPAGGFFARAGYGVTDRFLPSLGGGWTLTRQFGVYYNFFDLFPRLDFFLGDDLYLLGEGGLTVANASSGSRVDGFSPTGGVTRWGYSGGAGVGYLFHTGAHFVLGGEALGLYRRISGGDFLEPAVRLVLTWEL